MRDNQPMNDLPNLGPADNRRQSQGQAARAKAGGSRAGLAVGALALVAALGVAGWSYLQYQQTATSLTQAQQELADSDKRLSQLEAIVNASQMTTSESGQKLQTTLSQVKMGQDYINEQQQQLQGQYQQWQKSIESQLQDMLSQLQSVANRQGDQDRTQDSLGDRISALSRQLDGQSSRLDTLDKGATDTQKQSSDLGDKLTALENQLDQLAKTQKQQQTALSEVAGAKDTDLGNKVTSIDDEQQKLVKQLAALQAQFDVEKKSLAEQQNALSALRAQRSAAAAATPKDDIKFTAMEERVSVLEEAIRSIDSFRQQINERLVRVEKRVR